jgi:hypothetical protein
MSLSDTAESKVLAVKATVVMKSHPHSNLFDTHTGMTGTRLSRVRFPPDQWQVHRFSGGTFASTCATWRPHPE